MYYGRENDSLNELIIIKVEIFSMFYLVNKFDIKKI
jgi:hypothetical protein